MQPFTNFHPRLRRAAPAFLRAALLALVLWGVAGLTGCGSSREAAPPKATEKVVIREGARFHLPDGWLDFSRDTLSTGILWLVRRDYRATVGVEEVHLAGNPAELADVAHALLRLETGAPGGHMVSPPAEEEVHGGKAVAFQIVRSGGDEVRVAVVRKEGKTYAVTAVQRKEAPTPFAELAGVQRMVVEDLLR